MKVSSVNNQSFNGLYLKNVRPDTVKKFIKPNLSELKNLSNDLDITLSSGSVLQKHKTFVCPRQTIDVVITPKDDVLTDVAYAKHSMILDSTSDSDDLFSLVRTIVKNIF